MVKRICTICRKEFEATKENFYRDRNAKHGLKSSCKACERKRTRENYRKRKGIPVVSHEERLEAASVEMKDVLAKEYEDGVYEIKTRGGWQAKRSWSKFKGEMIQQTERFITLESKEGLVESFLKIDLMTTAKVEKVS